MTIEFVNMYYNHQKIIKAALDKKEITPDFIYKIEILNFPE
jgi:hypothetical protein